MFTRGPSRGEVAMVYLQYGNSESRSCIHRVHLSSSHWVFESISVCRCMPRYGDVSRGRSSRESNSKSKGGKVPAIDSSDSTPRMDNEESPSRYELIQFSIGDYSVPCYLDLDRHKGEVGVAHC